MTLNDNIREIRKARGMTQEQLAEAMGVSNASVSKWETGQAAPDISGLMALADFFEVSVDTLLGHEIKADRKKALTDEMFSLADEGKFDEAKQIAQKLLRNYPNSYETVESVSSLYYQSHVRSMNDADMKYAIELTHRLFGLLDDPTGLKRFDLLMQQGNQYENIGDWKMARKYYEESNVSGINDRALARILMHEEKTEEAMDAISKVLWEELFQLYLDVMLLQQGWTNLGQTEKARSAINWVLAVLNLAGPTAVKGYAPLVSTIYLQSAAHADTMGDHAAAEEDIRSAVRAACEKCKSDAAEFLTSSPRKLLVSNNLRSPEAFMQILEEMDNQQFLDAARDEMKKCTEGK